MNGNELARLSGLNGGDTIKMNSIIEITVQTKAIDSAVDSIISALYSVSFPGCWTLNKINDKEIDDEIILNDSNKKDGESDREKIRHILESISTNGSIHGLRLMFKYTENNTETSEMLDNEFEDKLKELENGV